METTHRETGAASNVSRDVCWVDLRSGSEFYFALLPILP